MNPMLLFAPLNKFLRKLPGKWFIILIALVWTVGLGTRRINNRICLIITLVIVAIWLIYALIVWIVKGKTGKAKTQERPDDLVIGFEERLSNAIGVAKDSHWYMIMGPSGCGKTSIIGNSELDFSRIYSSQKDPIKDEVKKTENCDLFLTKEGIIFDTTGRYVDSGKDARVNKEWHSLLSIIQRHRKLRQVEGLIIAMDVATLFQGDENNIQQQAKSIRDRIDEITADLKITFPIYLVFTKCDLVYGFADFFNDLNESERRQVWGTTLKVGQRENAEAAFSRECELLFQSLKTRRLFKLADAEKDERRSIYNFPLQFNEAYKKLTRFVAALFPSVSEESSPFRGFYFTGIAAAGGQAANRDIYGQSPIEFMMERVSGLFERKPNLISAQTPKEKGEAKGYFIRDIFNQIIFPDRDLAKPTTLADRRRTLIRLWICISAFAVTLGIIALLTGSYFVNKSLMSETSTRGETVSKINDNTSPNEKRDALEKLRKPIIRLESSSIPSLFWRGQRDEVAITARLLYLTKKYGSSAGYQTKLKRKVRIPVGVFRSDPEKSFNDPDKLTPISKVNIKAFVMGREYRLKTNKDGYANLKAKVRDGRVNITFFTNYKETGYEVERNKEYEISPGETIVSEENAPRFVFSKLRRIIEVQCLDQFNAKLAGVPVSILDEESNKIEPKNTNEQGIIRFELEAQEGSSFMVYYGDSPTNYKVDAPDVVKIESGRTEYTVEKQLRRKIQVMVTAFTIRGDDSQQAKPGVSIIVGEVQLGTTDNAGQWTGPSDAVPNSRTVIAMPKPDNIEVHATPLGYNIVLKYYSSQSDQGSSSGSSGQSVSIRQPETQYLKVADSSQRAIRGVEVWVYSQSGDESIFRTDDVMDFASGGRQIRLLRLRGTTNNDGKMEIPGGIQSREFLLYHPDYWPQKASLGSQNIRLNNIEQGQSIANFDQTQIDGSNYFYEKAKKEHQNWDKGKAIELYQDAIRLLPRKWLYHGLGAAYREINKEQESLAIVRKGLKVSLDDPRTSTLQSSYQKDLMKLEERIR